jgi:hypothetical protein
MPTCNVFNNATLLGTGLIDAGATTITGWSAQAGAPEVALKDITVAITSPLNSGATFQTRCLSDDGAGTLTLKDPNPFSSDW